MRRLLSALTIALIFVLVFSISVLAAWEFYFPTTVLNTDDYARTNYATLLDYGGQGFVDSGKILATGLDTNMQIGSTDIPFMITTTQVATVIPNLPLSGQETCSLYTGYTPNQTNFPVIVGEGGRVEYYDNAALEPGVNFEIEFDGYVDTAKAHHPLVYKPGAILVDVSAAGTITAGAINADSYDVTPIAFAAWTDVDVTNYVPDRATGVVVEIDTGGNPRQTGVRKNGSTDDRRTDTRHYWAMIGLDDSEIFEVYLEDNTCNIYLRAFTDENWVFNTNADDISLGAALAWTDIDISTEAPDAVGAIVEIVNNFDAARQSGVRKNGSTDNRHPDLWRLQHTFRVVGLDDAQIFEGYVESLDVDYYLIGYVTGGATFATDATDKSLGVSTVWTNVDCSVEAPDATYLFFEDITTNNTGMGHREEGSTDNIIEDATEYQMQGIVKCDINQVIESYEQNFAWASSWLIGYTEWGIYPAFPNPTYIVSSSVGGGAMVSGVKNIKVTGDGANLTLDVDGTTDVNAIGAGVTDTTNNWRLMAPAITYLTDYYHTVGGVLQLTYEPDNMLVDNVVEDETNAFNGTIAWGKLLSVSYGEMVGYDSTDAEAADVGGFDMPSSPMPSTWFGDASGVANLPAYDSFNSVATDIGMPVQTLYFWAIIGLAMGCALFVVMFTRSALLGVMAMVLVLFVGSSQTIIPMWIPFSILIVDIGIMYLYRQVSY